MDEDLLTQEVYFAKMGVFSGIDNGNDNKSLTQQDRTSDIAAEKEEEEVQIG